MKRLSKIKTLLDFESARPSGISQQPSIQDQNHRYPKQHQTTRLRQLYKVDVLDLRQLFVG